MPGSKTYTSNKVNELLESEFLTSINGMEKGRIKSLSKLFFEETIKVILSLLVTTIIGVFSNIADEEAGNLEYNLKIIAIGLAIFLGAYLLLNGLHWVVRWLFHAVFNKRILRSEKKKAFWKFHKQIINHIYLGISFENKYNEYLRHSSENENDLNFDLAMNYLSQAVHYFEIAENELDDLIPDTVSSNKKPIKDANFLAHVGYPLLNVSLVSAQRSLNRLFKSKNELVRIIDKVQASSNVEAIKTGYLNSEIALFDEISSYTGKYNQFLERTLFLQETYNNQKNKKN